MLFAFLFRGKLRDALRDSLDKAERKDAGLALRLHLSAARDLAALPWEYLYDPAGQRFLVQSDDLEVARLLGHDPGRSQPLGAQLRILAIGANPYRDLNVEGELQNLESVSGNLITRLVPPTLARLQEVLAKDDFDVLHFAGHGNFEARGRGGVLVFENASGAPAPVPATTLASILQHHPYLQIVVLNACKGSQESPRVLLPGIAESLVLHGVRTVVAMPGRIGDDDAIAFAGGFYPALAATHSVEHALGCGRDVMTGGDMEWALPGLLTCEGAMVPGSRLGPRVFAVAASVFAGFALCHWSPTCKPLAITYPADHAEVRDSEDIAGTSCHLPPGQDAWVVVYSPEDDRFFPHRAKAHVFPDGGWESTMTTIGGEQDGGKEFKLYAVLADEQVGSLLAGAAAIGMKDLPPGVKFNPPITVIRRR